MSPDGDLIGAPVVELQADVWLIERDPAGGYVTAALPDDSFLQSRNNGFGILWSQVQAELGEPTALAVGDSSRIFSVGGSSSQNWIAEFDPDDGSDVWSVRTGDVAALGRAMDVTVAPNGDIIVSGTRGGAPWLARLAASGDTLWAREASEAGEFSSVAVRPDGSVVACGTVDGGGQGDNIFVASYTQ